EDGIRDFHVTGVQTCALPICWPACSCYSAAGSPRVALIANNVTSGYITPALTRRNGVSFRLSSRSASTQVVRFFNGDTKTMTSSDLVMEGVELMFMGMGTVFVFLMMLVGLINL